MTSNERFELEKRILHYIKTTDFSDLSLVNDEERSYIEPERLEEYIEKDTKIKSLRILIEKKQEIINQKEELIKKKDEIINQKEELIKKKTNYLLKKIYFL